MMIIGTRGSRLALAQTNQVIEQLRKLNPRLTIETKIISTKGDADETTPLQEMGNGIFTTALEQALLTGEIDMAVHSTKDMPSKMPEALELIPIGIREDARDVIILKSCYGHIDELPRYARIGTGSERRMFQLQTMHPEWQMRQLRGNIDTRLKKLEEEELDAIVVAAAGIKRLGLENLIEYCYPINKLLPAPCQGIISVEIRKEDKKLKQLLAQLIDPLTEMQFKAERALARHIGSDCHTPIGAYCTFERGHLRLRGLLGDKDYLVLCEICGPVNSEEEIGKELAQMLKRRLMVLRKVKISVQPT